MPRDARFLRAFGLAVVMHMIWDSPLRLPFHIVRIALGFVIWVALPGYVQSGLRQIRQAQATGATGFCRKEQMTGAA